MSSPQLDQMKTDLQNALAPEWKKSIYKQAIEYNRHMEAFRDVFKNYETLMEKNNQMKERNDQLEREVVKLNAANLEQTKSLRSVQDSATSAQVIPELEKKIQTLQEDLTSSYKRTSENSQMILDLNKHIKIMGEDIKHKEIEIEEWKSRLHEAEETIKKLEETASEEDIVMEVLRGEVVALQTELVKSEEKAKTLIAENNQLIARWLEYKSQEAQHMNDAMDIAQGAMKSNIQAGIQKRVNQSKEQDVNALSNAPSILDTMSRNVGMKVVVPTKVLRSIEAHKGEVCASKFNFAGTILATGGADKLVKLWDTRSQYSARTSLHGATQSIMSVDFSYNDEMVLAACNDNAVRIWTIQTGRTKHTLTGHEGKVMSATFTPDSNKVVSGSHDRTIKIWDLSKGYCIKTVFCFSSCNSLALNTEGKMAISGHFDHQLRFWDIRSGEAIKEMDDLHTTQITSVSLSPDGNLVLTNSRDNTLKTVDIRTQTQVASFSDENYKSGANWNTACFSPDGQFVVAGGNDGKVFVWSTITNKLVSTLKPSSNNPTTIYGCSWGANLDLVSVDKGGYLSVWG